MSGWNVVRQGPDGWTPVRAENPDRGAYTTITGANVACLALNDADADREKRAKAAGCWVPPTVELFRGRVSYAARIAFDLIERITNGGGEVLIRPGDFLNPKSGMSATITLPADNEAGFVTYRGSHPSDVEGDPQGVPASARLALNRALQNFEEGRVHAEPAPKLACALCLRPVLPEHLCAGCKAYICSDCDHPDADERPQKANHSPSEHRRHLQ